MNQVKTVQLEIPGDLDRAFPVIKQLRTNLTLEDFSGLVKLAAAADGYKLMAREDRGRILAVMGFRILHDLNHGSHLYVDDLVTSKGFRGQGHGAELLRFAEAEARRLGLTGLRLSTGIENEGAKRFYDREGWQARALVYKRKATTH
jgi:ribosomal protein S18 acetylase RimI-like enzyme